MSQYGSLWIILIWNSGLPGSECLFPSPDKGSFQPFVFLISFLHFLSFPSGTPIMHILVCLMVSHMSLKLSSLFFVFVCLFLWMNSTALSSSLLILSSTRFSMMLNSSNGFFSCYCIFQLCVFCFARFDIFYLCWDSKFVHALVSWPWWTSLWLLFWTLYLVNHLCSFHFISGDISFSFIWNIFLFLHFLWLFLLVSKY